MNHDTSTLILCMMQHQYDVCGLHRCKAFWRHATAKRIYRHFLCAYSCGCSATPAPGQRQGELRQVRGAHLPALLQAVHHAVGREENQQPVRHHPGNGCNAPAKAVLKQHSGWVLAMIQTINIPGASTFPAASFSTNPPPGLRLRALWTTTLLPGSQGIFYDRLAPCRLDD